MTTPDAHNEKHTHETREREVIVTNGESRSYGGLVVAILAIVIFGVLGYLFVGAMGGDGGSSPMPEEVDVNVDSGGGGG